MCQSKFGRSYEDAREVNAIKSIERCVNDMNKICNVRCQHVSTSTKPPASAASLYEGQSQTTRAPLTNFYSTCAVADESHIAHRLQNLDSLSYKHLSYKNDRPLFDCRLGQISAWIIETYIHNLIIKRAVTTTSRDLAFNLQSTTSINLDLIWTNESE